MLAERVARRFLAGRLQLGPPRAEAQATTVLRRSKLTARNKGDRTGATLSAGYYAKKLDKTMFIYEGNSNMHVVWRVSFKPSDYLDPINNTGAVVHSVSPDLEVLTYDVKRSGP